MTYSLFVNNRSMKADVEADTPVLWVLRDSLGLTGTKFGCGIAMCGACTIHVDGEARRSCVTPVASVGNARINTIEALQQSAIGRALQDAWLELEVVQCGYCQSGQLMSAAALLAANPSPTDEDIDAVMSGNICRCGTYGRIRAGIKRAVSQIAAAARTTP
jgi:isoquinoline 1-oxidoreductase alpha subunit